MRVYELNGVNGLDSIILTERAAPKALRGQILIRMKAWSLNYRDLLIINDNHNGLRPNHTIALSDGAGEVVGLGPDVKRFKVGDRVTPTFSSSWVAGPMTTVDPPRFRGAVVDGVLAELVACDEPHAVHVPDHLLPGSRHAALRGRNSQQRSVRAPPADERPDRANARDGRGIDLRHTVSVRSRRAGHLYLVQQ